MKRFWAGASPEWKRRRAKNISKFWAGLPVEEKHSRSVKHLGAYAEMRPELAPTEHPTNYDIVLAAGWFEGDGTCGRNRQAYADLGQRKRWICDRLRALFGGRVSKTIHQRTGGDFFFWRVSGPRARGFLMTIYMFLSPHRKEQVRKALGVTLEKQTLKVA